jgi:hypothetical protein
VQVGLLGYARLGRDSLRVMRARFAATRARPSE